MRELLKNEITAESLDNKVDTLVVVGKNYQSLSKITSQIFFVLYLQSLLLNSALPVLDLEKKSGLAPRLYSKRLKS